MVDFNSAELFSANKGEILNLIILGRRDETINAFQMWRETKLNNSGDARIKHKLLSCMSALYLEIAEALERKIKDEALIFSLKKALFGNFNVTDNEIIFIFRTLNGVLDELNLIKIDTRKNIDTTNIEEENLEKGL
jgi:hypothetical protein